MTGTCQTEYTLDTSWSTQNPYSLGHIFQDQSRLRSCEKVHGKKEDHGRKMCSSTSGDQLIYLKLTVPRSYNRSLADAAEPEALSSEPEVPLRSSEPVSNGLSAVI